MDPSFQDETEQALIRQHAYQVTDKLLLRPVLQSEAQVSFDLVDKNRERLREWLYWVDDIRYVKDECKFVKEAQARVQDGKTLELGLYYRVSTSSEEWTMIGMCGFVTILNDHGKLGYWIDSSFTGKGIITACCTYLIKLGLETLKFDSISLDAEPENVKSIAVAKRLGLVTDGIVYQSNQFGKEVDVFTFTLPKTKPT
uniref:Uncharacterized protein LOC100185738 n=1 Tax=Phallusia mammillata TaxID=59560 RepID=A0A6F9DHQ6_9ASCI|nr:uncharacterized protein LOC100185738 [Phallusia mammillata]